VGSHAPELLGIELPIAPHTQPHSRPCPPLAAANLPTPLTHTQLRERQSLQEQRKMANMTASLQRQEMTKVGGFIGGVGLLHQRFCVGGEAALLAHNNRWRIPSS